MGIKDYLKYIEPEDINQKIRIYEDFYLDCNYMCHYLIYKCNNDNDLYSKLYNYCEYLLKTIEITNEFIFVFDGEYDETLISNPKLQTHLIRAKSKQKSDNYDKQPIHPGSTILKTFKEFLTDIISGFKKINKSNFKINIIGDNIKGEADIKILNSILKSDKKNICICSKDSDMILIAQSISIKKLIKIDILSNLRPIQFINIETFKKYGLDYVIIVLLLGNDYLPKISNINYKNLINVYDSYIKFNNPIIQNNNIDYDNLVNYISYIIVKSNKKIKFNFKNLNQNRFQIYINNLLWCLGYYKVLDINNIYIQEINNNTDEIKLRNVINIYNFINFKFV
jgi:hypothetical protein